MRFFDVSYLKEDGKESGEEESGEEAGEKEPVQKKQKAMQPVGQAKNEAFFSDL